MKLRECYGTDEVNLASPICKKCPDMIRCAKHIIHKGRGVRIKGSHRIYKVKEIYLYTSKTK